MGNSKQTFVRLLQLLTIVAVICVPWIATKLASAAPTYTSPNYGIDEVFMGAGGLNDASSSQYSARMSLGDTAVGNASSGNFQLYGGFTTNVDPYLEFYIPSTSINLGVLSAGTPKVTTATFTVRTYLASGYSVVSNSNPPKNGNYTMQTPAVPTASAPNTEQFGINLVANNIAGIGAFGSDPVQVPDGTFAFGYAANGYDTTNLFKYASGDVIARSNFSSSSTDYTISYMYNISEITPGGEYYFVHDLVATSYF